MRLRVLGTVAVGTWLLASSASAQAGFGGAQGRGATFTPAPPAQVPPPSPVTPIVPAPPPRQDLFRAGPDTFAPRFDGPNQSLFFPYFLAPGYPTAYGNVHDRLTTVIVAPVVMATQPPPLPLPVATDAPAALPVAAPGIAKTLYVIPGCYGGDTPPRADRLPAGCAAANMRTIKPTGIKEK